MQLSLSNSLLLAGLLTGLSYASSFYLLLLNNPNYS